MARGIRTLTSSLEETRADPLNTIPTWSPRSVLPRQSPGNLPVRRLIGPLVFFKLLGSKGASCSYLNSCWMVLTILILLFLILWFVTLFPTPLSPYAGWFAWLWAFFMVAKLIGLSELFK